MDDGFLDEVRTPRRPPRRAVPHGPPGARLPGAALPRRGRRAAGRGGRRGGPSHPRVRPASAGVVPAGPSHRVARHRRPMARTTQWPWSLRSARSGRGPGRTDERLGGNTMTSPPPTPPSSDSRSTTVPATTSWSRSTPGEGPLPVDLVRALCDRRFGVGADGVIRVLAGDGTADLTMVLQNADGGEAEMSGNGMRCLAQAAVLSAMVFPPTFTVATAAGVKTVDLPGGRPDPHRGGHRRARPGGARRRPGPEVHRPQGPDRGHGQSPPRDVRPGPDLDEVDVVGIGTQLQSVYDGGINVEFITSGEEPDNLVLRVFERGVGETQACGTGQRGRGRRRPQLGAGGHRGRRAQSGGHAPRDAGRRRDPAAGPRAPGRLRGRSTRPPSWPGPARC